MTTDNKLSEYVLSRLHYFNGQFLKQEDFIDEQNYHVDGRRRHERLLHTAGIAEGLELSLAQEANVLKLKVSAGTAMDKAGRQILLKTDRLIDIKPEWTGPMWVVIRFQEVPDRIPDDNQSSGGASNHTRFTQQPLIDVVPDVAPLQAYHPVVLEKVTFSATAQPAFSGTRTHAGVRLPGSKTYGIYSASGSLHLTDVGANTDRLTIDGNGNVGIGVEQPKARLNISMPGVPPLPGDKHSKALSVMAGPLGNEKAKELALTSIGFRSGNHTALGIRAYRFADGSDWLTTAIGLCLDVDETPRANSDVSLWLHSKGHVVIGKPPDAIPDKNHKLHVQGGTFVGGSLSVVGGSLSLTAAENKTRFILHPPSSGDFLQLTNDNANKEWEWGQGITYRPTGRVGINTRDPAALLSVCMPGETQLQGTAMSSTLLVTAGTLGNEKSSELSLASIGFRSGNHSALGIRAYRTQNGADWQTTAIGLGMDVDSSPRVNDASLWLHASGHVVVGGREVVPSSRLHVHGSARVDENISYGGQLSKLDVQDQAHAMVRAQVLYLGNAANRGDPGRALVDFKNTLFINYGDNNLTDWPRLILGGREHIQLEANATTASGKLHVQGDITYEGVLSKLNVKESDYAFVRTRDLYIGHSARRGSPGRALVDLTDTLTVNFGDNDGSDWPKLSLRGKEYIRLETKLASISGRLCIGTNAPAAEAALDVRVPGASGSWDRFVVNATADWGDGTNKYVTIGGGGAVGIMLANPHVSWMKGEDRASIRYGRSGGISTGAWWDVGVRANNAFSFAYNDGLEHKLWLSADGSVGIGTTTPSSKLHVNGDLRVNSTIYEGGQALSSKYAGLVHSHNVLYSSGGRYGLFMQDDDNLVIYDNKLPAGQNAIWSRHSPSDAGLKQEVETLEGVTEKLRKLRGVSFSWRQKERGTKRELGVIAQEVQAVFPELVRSIDGKQLGVQYEKFAGVLIQALKEQDARITQLEERLRTLGALA